MPGPAAICWCCFSYENWFQTIALIFCTCCLIHTARLQHRSCHVMFSKETRRLAAARARHVTWLTTCGTSCVEGRAFWLTSDAQLAPFL